MSDYPAIHVVKAGLDVASLLTLGGYFIDHLPAIATGLPAVWYAIQIFEHFRKRK